MDDLAMAGSFLKTGAAYDAFMGRYSAPLAVAFCNAANLRANVSVLDVGCGPGALTTELAARFGPASTTAIDPSPPFVADCRNRCPGVTVELGSAEEIPFPDRSFDAVLSQLVLHFVRTADRAAAEFRRVLRPGGVAGACVWDFAEEMEMLRHFWDAALTVDPHAPDEARVLHFGRAGEIASWLRGAGFTSVEEAELEVSADYRDFADLWSGFELGIGPAGAYCVSVGEDARAAIRDELFVRLGSPQSAFTLRAKALSAFGRIEA